MKRLLLTLSVALLLASGLVAVLRTQQASPPPPLPLLEPMPMLQSREVLVRSEQPAAATSDRAISAQPCNYDPDARLGPLRRLPAPEERAAAAGEVAYQPGLPLDPAAMPDETDSGDFVPARLPVRLPPIREQEPPAIKLVPPQASERHHQPSKVPLQVLLHAGGAIEAEFPHDWRVFEVTEGRQVSAVLLPADAEAPSEYRHDGIWLTHIALPPQRPWSQESLSEEFARRLSGLAGKPIVVESPAPSMLGPWESLSVDYQLGGANHAQSTGQTQDETVGRFMLVRTAWGLVEINAVSPRSLSASRQAAYLPVLRSLKLEAPSAPTVIAPHLNGTRELLGSWKGSRSRIRLHGDARFELLLDPARPVAIHPPADPSEQPSIHRLIGEYHTRDDLIFVQWKDGSQSNYRWKLDGGELLLTDHQGRISRLSKLYE